MSACKVMQPLDNHNPAAVKTWNLSNIAWQSADPDGSKLGGTGRRACTLRFKSVTVILFHLALLRGDSETSDIFSLTIRIATRVRTLHRLAVLPKPRPLNIQTNLKDLLKSSRLRVAASLREASGMSRGGSRARSRTSFISLRQAPSPTTKPSGAASGIPPNPRPPANRPCVSFSNERQLPVRLLYSASGQSRGPRLFWRAGRHAAIQERD